MNELQVGQVTSAAALIVGFGLQIVGAVILRCVNKKDQWCEDLIEVDGIIALIGGMFFLVIFSMLSQSEFEVGRFLKRCCTAKQTTP